MKKWIILMMAVLLVFCLAGCQKEDAETPPAQGTEAAEAQLAELQAGR